MTAVYLIYAILGISIIIFIHELGHFLAAKKVGVRVERFSVGFDPTVFGIRLRLLGFTRGDTEYIVGLVPFGGYVKLAGETAMEAGAEKQEPQPDWLVSKPPGARALVFAAGAIFNIISAFFFFALAFSLGVTFWSPDIGIVMPGSPAWEAGLKPGDRIVAIDGEPIDEYTELMLAAAFADTDRPLDVEYTSPGDDTVKRAAITPEWNEELGFQIIGVERAIDPSVDEVSKDGAAARAGIERKDRVVGLRFGKLELTEFRSHMALNRQIEALLREFPGSKFELLVEKPGGERSWKTLEPREKEEETRTLLGVLNAAAGEVVRAIQPSSELESVFEPGDLLISLDGVPVQSLSTAIIASVVSAPGRPAGEIKVEIQREDGALESVEIGADELATGLAHEEIFIHRTHLELGALADDSPLASAGLRSGDILYRIGSKWVSTPDNLREAAREFSGETVPVSVLRAGRVVSPPLQVSLEVLRRATSGGNNPFDVSPLVRVANAGVAQRIGIESGSRIVKIGSRLLQSWEQLQEAVQAAGDDEVEIVWRTSDGEKKSATTTLQSKQFESLGIAYKPMQHVVQTGILESAAMGVERVKVVSQQVFLTLRGLVKRQVKARNLSGPIGIVHIIYRISEYGFGTLIYFMALISVNLGVLNLLPIPILDGGHLLFLLFEKIKGSPVDIRIQEVATMVAFLFIITLALWVTFWDLQRLFGAA